MTDDAARIVQAVGELIDANTRAIAQMEATNSVLRCGIDHLEDGAGVLEALRVLPVAARRLATQDAFQRVVTARHRLRLRAIVACADAGMSPLQIAEIWGVSRQRVAQYLTEAKKQALPVTT
jgi:DNA-directed RNA polymerase specialized sigma24 family protein